MPKQALVGEERLTIGGELRAASDRQVFLVENPTNEEIIGEVADASPRDAADAVDAARRAFDETGWSSDVGLRIRCLEQLKTGIVNHLEELRSVLVEEAGCPISFTRGVQLDLAPREIDAAVQLASDYPWETVIDESATDRTVVRREPRGVVAAITPFNYPLYLNIRKVAPALAAGCAVVLKPSPLTPWSATVLGRIAIEETDIPPGVLNVVTSSHPEVGHALTSDPGVDMVTFVGSSAVGRSIMAQAAPTLKKVVLELGGKSAQVILEDADVARFAAVAAGVGLHAGQGCARLTRFLVHRARYDEAVAAAAAAFAGIVVGDPWDEATVQGPQISEAQQERVLALIDRARKEGARCAFGGGGVPRGMTSGWFVEPTLLVDVDPDAEIAQQEIFGPVAVMIPFDDDDHAVAIANNSVYGLSGAVASGDPNRALSVARRIRTGQVIVNGARPGQSAPFSGWKQSGLGVDNGPFGFEEHLAAKAIALPADLRLR